MAFYPFFKVVTSELFVKRFFYVCSLGEEMVQKSSTLCSP